MHLKPSTRPKKGRLPLQFLLELCHFLGSCCEARLRFQGFLLQVLILGGKGTQAHWYSRMPSSNIRRRYLFCRVPRKYLGAWLVLPSLQRFCLLLQELPPPPSEPGPLPREPNPSSPCVRHDSRGRARLFFFFGRKTQVCQDKLKIQF